jgi:hypothetical protein
LTPEQQQHYRQVQSLVTQHRPLLGRLFQAVGLPASGVEGSTFRLHDLDRGSESG